MDEKEQEFINEQMAHEGQKTLMETIDADLRSLEEADAIVDRLTEEVKEEAKNPQAPVPMKNPVGAKERKVTLMWISGPDPQVVVDCGNDPIPAIELIQVFSNVNNNILAQYYSKARAKESPGNEVKNEIQPIDTEVKDGTEITPV